MFEVAYAHTCMHRSTHKLVLEAGKKGRRTLHHAGVIAALLYYNVEFYTWLACVAFNYHFVLFLGVSTITATSCGATLALTSLVADPRSTCPITSRTVAATPGSSHKSENHAVICHIRPKISHKNGGDESKRVTKKKKKRPEIAPLKARA